MVTLSTPHYTTDFITTKYDKKIVESTEPDNSGLKTIELDLKLESDRLKTFIGWRSQAVSPQALAKAGFYYLNRSDNFDLVKCAFCNAEICSWEAGDDPFEEHRKWSPNCPLTRQPPSLPFLSRPGGQDVCGNAEVCPNSVPENEAFARLNSMMRSFDEYEMRLETFSRWPTSLAQRPQSLAQAGFYYRGVEDHTICFSCGGALRDWKPEDDPWEQHAMWFPTCKFLLQKKGAEYVQGVQRKFKSDDQTATKEAHSLSGSVSEALPLEQEVLLCKICDSAERNTIFNPCHHILTCDKCATKLKTCPVCRQTIDNTMKVFLA